MNKIITGAFIIAVCSLSACSNNDQEDDAGLTNTTSSVPGAIRADSQTFVKPTSSLPVSSPAAINPLPQPVLNQGASIGVAPGMNPAHGQPNHRCDIAVGAPLNSPATKPGIQTSPAAPSPAIQAITTPAQTAINKTVTAAGMNPRHGEPGHRCDIAVGAPLNSPVIKPPTQTLTTTPVTAPVIPPAKKDSGN